jgi:transposase InsO family protein
LVEQYAEIEWPSTSSIGNILLTLLDADTRYLLRAEPMLDPTGEHVEKVLDSAFQEFGLPKAMRSDNGPPFASTGAGRLSRLSVWWLKLCIQLERIEPGKPQQNAASSDAT